MWWEIPNHLEVKNGQLHFAGRNTLDIAKEFGTPLYIYNSKRVIETYRRFYSTLKKHIKMEVRVHYALKANSNPEILRSLSKEGAWIDAVSPEEVNIAITAGFPPNKIMFTGTSVSNEDLRTLVKLGVRINIDSLSELKRLNRIKTGMKVSIRMDPGLVGGGHNWKVITAGKRSHGVPIKFGIPQNEIMGVAKEAKEYGFDVVGLHEHVGSNWHTGAEIEEFLKTADIMLATAKNMAEMRGKKLEFLNFGGGHGVRYKKEHSEFPLDKYAQYLSEKIEESGIECEAICFEPGRYLVADSALLLIKVVDVKSRYGDLIVGVNSGFNNLIRPAMYSAYHEIINCSKADKKNDTKGTVAGNLCETGDVFTLSPRSMPMPEEGDILAIHNAGAYGYSMASNYNLRGYPKEVVF